MAGTWTASLASRAKAGGQLAQQPRMVGNPLQARVGEHEVEARLGADRADVA